MDYASQVAAARKAGYSDAEIIGHLAQTDPKVQQAKQAGYADADILGHIAPARPQRNAFGVVTDAMAGFNRGLGVGDELAAVGATAGDVLGGEVKWKPGDFGGAVNAVRNAFSNRMAEQRQDEDRFAVQHPVASPLMRGTGMAATNLVPATKAANAFATSTRAMNMARGATTAGLSAAGYAAADRGTLQERLKAASDASTNPVVLALGAGAGALAPAVKAPPKAPKPLPKDAQILADIGVTTTIPQRMGRGVKATEDLLSRAPIVGIAKAGLQDRQLEQLNRGIALKALEPIGGTIPKTVKPGFEMVEHVDNQIGKVYDKAAALAPKVDVGAGLTQDMSRIAARKVDLAESEARLFDSAINDRMTRLSQGVPSGEMVKQIQSEIGTLQAEAARKGQTTLSSMFGETRKALMDAIGRSSPQSGALIKKADKAWGLYSILNDAAAAAPAGKNGVALPSNFHTQDRMAAKAMGSNMAGKGKGPLRDIITAASRTLPDSYGNPGTANAVGLGALGMQTLTNPPAGIATAGSLGAVSTPYFLMGRKVIESLPSNASRAQLANAASRLGQLAQKDPAVAALQREVAARASRAAGVAGAASQRNAFAQPANP